MEIRKSTAADKAVILQLFAYGRETMRASGNPLQWQEGYPKPETVDDDIAKGVSYICMEDGKPIGTFAMVPGPDPTYSVIYDGHWLDDIRPYYVIHRMAGAPGSHGIFKAAIDFCSSYCSNIRIDTHRDNTIMQHNMLKHGFKYCGIIHIESGDERLAYQRI